MNFMDKIYVFLEKRLLPVVEKVSSQRHLVALRNGFITTLTALFVGYVAVIINYVFLTSDALMGEKLNKLGFWKYSIQPIIDKWIINIGWQVQGGTLKIIGILLVFTISYYLAKSYKTDPLVTAVVALCAYFTLLPGKVPGLLKLENGSYAEVSANLYSIILFGVTAILAAVFTAFIATEIFVRITKKGWVIRIQEEIPQAAVKSFEALIPGSITLVIFGIIAVLFNVGLEKNVAAWINDTMQQSLMNIGQSPVIYILLIFIAQFLWLIGLGGMNILEDIIQPMYAPALLENTDLVVRGLEPKYALTRNFIDIYAMPGGSGGTLALIIAIFLFSKRQESKELSKLAICPGIFQINKPITFGLPIVLNIRYLIPLLIVSPLMLIIAWIFTEVIPFASYIQVAVPWTTPPIISAFVATNGDIKAAILAAAVLIFSVLLWIPFVISANKIGSGEEF